jgi:hypothetical protein
MAKFLPAWQKKVRAHKKNEKKAARTNLKKTGFFENLHFFQVVPNAP